jgi:hypothetical protein
MYDVSHDENDGLTIGDRIDIIENNESVYSCIRVSSNWLISSSYFYLDQIGIPLAYDITKLRRIA